MEGARHDPRQQRGGGWKDFTTEPPPTCTPTAAHPCRMSPCLPSLMSPESYCQSRSQALDLAGLAQIIRNRQVLQKLPAVQRDRDDSLPLVRVRASRRERVRAGARACMCTCACFAACVHARVFAPCACISPRRCVALWRRERGVWYENEVTGNLRHR